MTWWWPWLLTAVGGTAMWIAGSGRRIGWVIGASSEVLWITYSVLTKQWGFIPASLIYGGVFVRNWRVHES